MLTQKPILFLDVDGVINCFPGPTFEQLLMSQDWADGLATTKGRTYKIWWRRPIIERLTTLVNEGRIEIVWLTTWGQNAVTEISSLVGLNPTTAIEDTSGKRAPEPGWWKWERVKEAIGDTSRPFVWFDDELGPPITGFALSLYDGQAFLRAPESNPGLTIEDLDELEEWLHDKKL